MCSKYLVLFTLIGIAQCYKILMIFPVPARSHYILGNALARGLVSAGHDVTMVSGFEDKNPPKGYRDVILTGLLQARKDDPNFSVFDFEKMHPWLTVFFMNSIGNDIVNFTFENPHFKKLLNEKFDLIIMEQFKIDAMKVLECHFKAPLILFSTIGPNPWVNLDVSNPSPPSYIPDLFLSYTSRMNLWQRTFNSLTVLLQNMNSYLLFYPSQQKIIDQHFPKCADTDLAKRNISLILLNSHESSNEPVPLVPNMINIGGFHVNQPKQLPEDLKKFMDNAKEGVIYFSMGSNIDSSTMPEQIKKALIRTFAKLKHKVLWKYDLDSLPEQPHNVKLGKWFPQPDILAHPNTKLFITHGGLLSTLETIYHGVPVLTLPVFGDQKMNAAKAEMAGYGKKIPFSEISEDRLTEALNDLLNDPKYRENAKLRSILARDRPIKPLDLAVYWIEFVARHRGAPHLAVAGIKLPWYQYFLLDVILLVALVTIIIFSVLYFTCRKICCSKKVLKAKGKSKKD